MQPVWDSNSAEEYKECLTKSLILTERRAEFKLLETMLWRPGTGYFLLEEHLHRLLDSATFFGYPISILQIRRQLEEAAKGISTRPFKIRLLLDHMGQTKIETSPVPENTGSRPLIVGLAKEPVQSDDVLLYHKTTNRRVYEQARASNPDCDDVILWNERREITESTIANVVIKLNGRLFTPSIESGLLDGTFRSQLLKEQEIEERIVEIDDIQNAESLFLINSVQQWMPAELVS